VASVAAAELDEAVETARLRQGTADGCYGNTRAEWMDEFWANRSRGWFLAFVNTHNAEHLIAEALTVRSMGGFPLGI
jgi:hypothetical protein